MKNDDRPASVKEIAATLGRCEQPIRRYHENGNCQTFDLGGPHSSIKLTRVDLRRTEKKRRK